MAELSEQNMKILEWRLRGEKINVIADRLHLSKQSIHQRMKLFPSPKGIITKTPFTFEQEYAMVVTYFGMIENKSKFRNGNRDVLAKQLILQMHQMDEFKNYDVRDIYNTLSRMATHRPQTNIDQYVFYPNINQWCILYGLSLADLCRITGEKQAVVKDTLAGVEHMSLSMAKKIKKASNMSLYDIYYPIVPEKYLV